MRDCPHEQVRAVRKPGLTGPQVTAQCVKCGRNMGSNMPARYFTDSALAQIPLWKPVKAPTSRKRKLQAFYRTPAWKKQRERIIEIYGHECVYCGNPATEVHHVTYFEPLEDTPDFALRAICTDCHKNVPRP